MSEVRDFSSEYPEWKHLSRDAFNETLVKLEWNRVEGLELANACIEVFAAQAENTLTYVATWGDGSGFVFISPSTPQNKRALVETLESLQLTGSTCRWTLPASP